MPALLTARELREQRANLFSRMREIHSQAETENRNLNGEEQTEWDRLHAEQEALLARATRIEELEDREAELSESRGTKAGHRQDPAEDADPAATAEAESRAFQNYIRYGMAELSPEERQVMQRAYRPFGPGERRAAMTVGTDASGGYFVPEGFANQIVSAQKRFGGMRRAKTTQFTTSSGEPLPIPTDNDTSNTGALLAEESAAAEQAVTVGQAMLNAYMYTSKIVRVQIQLLQDSAFDIESWLGNKLGMRIGRIQNSHFTVGTGSSQPSGVVTGATLGVTAGTGNVAKVSYAELVQLQHSVDADYRENGAQWMFNDAMLSAIKQMVDGQSRPLFVPGVANGEPDTILGHTYVVNNDVAAPAASAKSILFGDFSNYFIRDVRGIQILRLSERYAEYLQVGFLAFARADGVLADAGTHPIKYLAQAAS